MSNVVLAIIVEYFVFQDCCETETKTLTFDE